MPLHCAQLSDLHLDGTDTTRQRLVRVVADLAQYAVPVDLILVTGDLVQCAAFAEDDREAKLAEYRFVHEQLSPLAPVGYCPGNSDDATFGVFLKETGIKAEGNNSRIDTGNTTFLLADSHVDRSSHGHLADATLEWLEGELSATTGSVVLAMHHPPPPFGHPVIDALRLDNASNLQHLVQRFPQIDGILCGHTHATAATQFAGRLLFVAPGVHSRGQHPWAYSKDVAADLLDTSVPPGYALHRIDVTGLTSFPVMLRG